MLVTAYSRRWRIFIIPLRGPRGAGVTLPAAAMTAVSSMHEHVKQRAGEQEQKRQVAEYMHPMLRDQVESGNRKKSDQHDIAPCPEIARRRILVLMMCGVLHGSFSLFVLIELVPARNYVSPYPVFPLYAALHAAFRQTFHLSISADSPSHFSDRV